MLGSILRKAAGPTYKRNCLNSVALNLFMSFKSLGFLENSQGKILAILEKFSEIILTFAVGSLVFMGPLNQSNRSFLVTPKQTKCI